MHFKYKFTLTLMLCILTICTMIPFAGAAETYVVTGAYGEVTLPAEGLAPGARSTNCWAFAQTIYELVWGVRFTGFRGTDDDLLRNVPDDERAITAENTERFISEAAPGATLRISTVLDGGDDNGRYKHSMILIGKDEDGFTVYEGSINGRVRIKYYTWSEFADSCFGRRYGYFKYIKWPGANALGETPDPVSPETDPVTCVSAIRSTGYLPGDVNSDGQITSSDARLLLRNVVRLEVFDPGTTAFFAADMDNDGEISSADARLVLRAAVQIAES